MYKMYRPRGLIPVLLAVLFLEAGLLRAQRHLPLP